MLTIIGDARRLVELFLKMESFSSSEERPNAEGIRHFENENEALRLQIIQIQEDFYAFQDTIDSLKSMFKSRISELEERCNVESEARALAEQRVVHLEDRCRFVEENSEAVTQYLQAKCAQRKDEAQYVAAKMGNVMPLRKKLLSLGIVGDSRQNVHSTLRASTNINVNGSTLQSTDSSEIDSERDLFLAARELQLERLASQLDKTHLHYLKQTDDCKDHLNQIERLRMTIGELQQALLKERRGKEDILLRLAQYDRATSYRNAISSSSVPVMVAIPDPQQLRPAPFLIPPQEFFAELRAEIESIMKYNVQTTGDTSGSSEDPAVQSNRDGKITPTYSGTNTGPTHFTKARVLGDKPHSIRQHGDNNSSQPATKHWTDGNPEGFASSFLSMASHCEVFGSAMYSSTTPSPSNAEPIAILDAPPDDSRSGLDTSTDPPSESDACMMRCDASVSFGDVSSVKVESPSHAVAVETPCGADNCEDSSSDALQENIRSTVATTDEFCDESHSRSEKCVNAVTTALGENNKDASLA